MAVFAKSEPWDDVAKRWKDEDGSNFSKLVLEQTFPGKRETQPARLKLWRELDGNGNGYVSLAEFDGWFNRHTLGIEKVRGQKSSIYAYARPALIRAFNLANGVSPAKPGQKLDGDAYITRSEFRLLLVATQAALCIFRIFDIADTSNDRRVSQAEWDCQLATINAELRSFGYSGPEMLQADFAKIDVDGKGMVLLDEAIFFFLGALTSEPALLSENAEEGC
ncbi:hypothetical protein M885DRAFT_618336 [Pelagophyceae sp. CCMP2097]|nr:hypothetical protein M885DRAFT_618336 [Pelagophyceae sp. CCMP2097]